MGLWFTGMGTGEVTRGDGSCCDPEYGNEGTLRRETRRPVRMVGKNMGKPRVVVFNVWEVYGRTSGDYRGRKTTKDMGPLVSVLDPATGKMSDFEGPDYGTPESEAFRASCPSDGSGACG